jgi:hypothetical protein
MRTPIKVTTNACTPMAITSGASGKRSSPALNPIARLVQTDAHPQRDSPQKAAPGHQQESVVLLVIATGQKHVEAERNE